MGMCRWIGSYFPRLDRTIGDTFSLELLELNRTFSVFGGSEKSGKWEDFYQCVNSLQDNLVEKLFFL